MRRKIVIMFLVLINIINIILPIANAAQLISKANLIYDHKINTHIKYYIANDWHDIKCGYICYKLDGKKYPAYCVSHGLNGVDEEGAYTVTINNLLNDKLIYNTIINGYPYKTAAQLGVETNDDAYVATKQAVNSVVLNRNVKKYYKAADEKGQKIINAIYNISEKGKAGNDVNADANLKVNKVDGLKEFNDDYYYQEYSLSANANISEYIIESIKNFPEGSYVSNTKGDKTEKYKANEKFRIMIPTKSLNSNISGTISVKASCNTKPIFFGEAPRNNIQNYAVTYKPSVEYKSTALLNESTNTASIKIIKKDEETSKPIKNVEFGLYNKDGKLINKLKTNDSGIITFKNLYQGDYYIKELNANENYIKDDEQYNISLKYNQQFLKEITNKHKKGKLKITKVDKDDNNKTLGGIEFDLIDSDQKVVCHLITDADGEITIDNINIGEYILKETKTKKEYNLCIDKEIKVKWNEISDITIQNEKKKGQIKIIKEDKDNNIIKLQGVKFQILDSKNRIIEEIKTDKNGEAITNRLPIGEYKIKEISLGKNVEYVLNEKENIIEVKDNEISELHIQNEKIKGQIKIIKESSKDSPILNIKKGDRISKITFEIYNDKNILVDTIITDENGQAISKKLEKGRYIVKEKNTKNEFLLNSDEFIINITRNNEVKILNIENEPIIPEVDVEKKGQQFAEKNEEIKYEFSINNKSNSNLDSFSWKEYIPFEKLQVTKMITGTYNENLNYKIYYKTNMNDYRLIREVNSYKNEYINLNTLNLEKNEQIIEIKVEYGEVSKDFKSIVKPNIYAKVNNNVKKGEKIINETEVFGCIQDYKCTDKSIFETLIKEKKIIKKLPKTGC